MSKRKLYETLRDAILGIEEVKIKTVDRWRNQLDRTDDGKEISLPRPAVYIELNVGDVMNWSYGIKTSEIEVVLHFDIVDHIHEKTKSYDIVDLVDMTLQRLRGDNGASGPNFSSLVEESSQIDDVPTNTDRPIKVYKTLLKESHAYTKYKEGEVTILDLTDKQIVTSVSYE